MQVPYRKPGKFGLVKNDPLLTKEKYNELKNKLVSLKKARPQLAAEVSRLAELGDFSENVEYQLAKGKLRGVNNGILKLETQLNQAIIIDSQLQTNMIQVGSTVTMFCNGKEVVYKILGSSETDPTKGIISYNSPIGSALVGHKVGEKVTIKMANREVEYEIIKID